MRSDIVLISKEFAYAKYDISRKQKQFIYFVLSKIDQRQLLKPHHIIEISVRDIAEFYGEQMKDTRVMLKKAAVVLREQEIEVDGKKMYWFEAMDYLPHEDKYLVRFSTDILPYISGLSGYYRIPLTWVQLIKSKYTYRLLDLLVVNKLRNDVEPACLISVDNFRKVLDLKGAYYKESRYIPRDIILPAISELHALGIYTVKFTPIKQGRSSSFYLFRYRLCGTSELTYEQAIKEFI